MYAHSPAYGDSGGPQPGVNVKKAAVNLVAQVFGDACVHFCWDYRRGVCLVLKETVTTFPRVIAPCHTPTISV